MMQWLFTRCILAFFINVEDPNTHFSNPCYIQIDGIHVVELFCKLDLSAYHQEIGECFMSAAFEALESLVEVCAKPHWFSIAFSVWLKPTLEGLRQEDFAVLGQFCAKIINWCLYPYTKCSCKTMRKISNEFYRRGLTIIFFCVIFSLKKIKVVKYHFNKLY